MPELPNGASVEEILTDCLFLAREETLAALRVFEEAGVDRLGAGTHPMNVLGPGEEPAVLKVSSCE